MKSPFFFQCWTTSKGAQNKSSPKEIYPLSGRTFSCLSAINQKHNAKFFFFSKLATIIRKDIFMICIGYEWLTCSGGMYQGVPLYTVLSSKFLASKAPTVTRPKSPIFTFSFSFLLNMMFSGCGKKKHQPRDWCHLTHASMASTSPSDPCGLNSWSGCTQLHWLFVGKLKDFSFSSPGFDYDSFFLSITWGFQWNTAPSGYRGTWVMNPGMAWTVHRTRQSDFSPKAPKWAQFQGARSLCAELWLASKLHW